MSADSKIEWTDATWNPVIGCTKVSPGCDNCYAIRTAHRMSSNPHPAIAAAYGGTEAEGEWTGQVNLLGDRLDQPLRWMKPKRIFVNSQSDLFHDQVPDEFIARVFAVMAVAQRHTFQLLTKRHGRMRSLLSSPAFQRLVLDHKVGSRWTPVDPWWPLPNVWLGVSVENQRWADIRIPALCHTPAAVRFLSCEPLLGPVDLALTAQMPVLHDEPLRVESVTVRRHIDWVIVGGESGPGARPMHPDWPRSLRDQCVAAGIPFHFKQWGEHRPRPTPARREDSALPPVPYRPGCPDPYPLGWVERVGKRAAGRELDGRTWDEYPEAVSE